MKSRGNHSYLIGILLIVSKKEYKGFTWNEQEILFSESFSPFQAIVDWLALKTTVLKLLTLRSLFRRLPMAADGTESKLCTGRRNVFNRLVINSLL